jgi:hypothetical protein
LKHEWMAVDGGPAATVCHMWCANCGTLWEVADMQDPARTNRYFIAGWAFETDGSSRPEGGLSDEPACPPKAAHVEISVSAPPPPVR